MIREWGYFFVSSEGENHLKWWLKSANKLTRYQRRLSKKMKCSNNRVKNRLDKE